MSRGPARFRIADIRRAAKAWGVEPSKVAVEISKDRTVTFVQVQAPVIPPPPPAAQSIAPLVNRDGVKGRGKMGYVYFALCERMRAIKIGWSLQPENRVYSLGCGTAAPITLLGTIPGQMAVERALHKKFAAIRLGGEWFEDTPELREHIAKVTG